MPYRLTNPGAAAPLFDGWEETMIWSCLSGVMGEIWGDDPEHPRSAAAVIGDFFFFAGAPDRRLAVSLPPCRRRAFRILVPRDGAWSALIRRCWGEQAAERTRWAIRKEPEVFDPARLRQMAAALPAGFRLAEMDEALFRRCREIPWCRDWVAQFADWALFRRYALGVVVMKEGEPVSGASAYSAWPGGIEVEIDTREDYRRRGLARAAAAALILGCLRRGLYPSWDAQNPASAALAESLGYHISHPYPVYEAVGPAPAD